MRFQWDSTGMGRLWQAPAALGAILVLFGVMIVLVPDLLEYIVAGVLILSGVSLLGLALGLRGRTVYRRYDEQHPSNWRDPNLD